MGSDNDISRIDEILLAFFKGGITFDEKLFLKQWLDRDVGNREVFRQMYMVWKTAGICRSNKSNVDNAYAALSKRLFEPQGSQQDEVSEKKLRRFKLVSYLKWVAVILLSLCSGIFMHSIYQQIHVHSMTGLLLSEIVVPLGSKSRIVLPDKTEVWLNAGSRLTYSVDYGKKLREVNLTGEGYFKVAKMLDKPFIVHTAKAHIKALGTEFNVKAYPEDRSVDAILVKGVIAVRKSTGKEVGDRFSPQNSVVLKPGQKIQIFREDRVLKNETAKGKDIPIGSQSINSKSEQKELTLQTSNIHVETSWKDSRWIIEGANLTELFVELGRRFNVSISMTDQELKKYQFSGIIQSETLEQVFNLMSLTIPMSYTIDKGKVEIKLNTQLENKYKRAYK